MFCTACSTLRCASLESSLHPYCHRPMFQLSVFISNTRANIPAFVLFHYNLYFTLQSIFSNANFCYVLVFSKVFQWFSVIITLSTKTFVQLYAIIQLYVTWHLLVSVVSSCIKVCPNLCSHIWNCWSTEGQILSLCAFECSVPFIEILFAFPSTLHLADTSFLKNNLRFMFPCDFMLLSILPQVFQISAFSPYSPRYYYRSNMAPFERISQPCMSTQRMLWLSFLQYLLLLWWFSNCCLSLTRDLLPNNPS